MKQLEATAYRLNRSAITGKPFHPLQWSWPIARLQLFKYDVDLIVLAGITDDTLAAGPAHMTASPLPGSPGNSIIVGDHDRYFDFLTKVTIGDRILVQRCDGSEFWFRVKSVEEAVNCAPKAKHEGCTLSLISRFPASSGVSGVRLRYVVTAHGLPVTGTTSDDNGHGYSDRTTTPTS